MYTLIENPFNVNPQPKLQEDMEQAKNDYYNMDERLVAMVVMITTTTDGYDDGGITYVK